MIMTTEVFELLVDFNGTTRSRFESMGLFTTQAKAEERYKQILAKAKGGVYGAHTVRPRFVE